MHSGIRIALVGDRNGRQKSHQAIPLALSAAPESEVEGVWIATDAVAKGESLAEYDGVWCVPGMPYSSAAGALKAIRHARTTRTPFLGSSAGFQYALIEYARNVLGFGEADHQKTTPNAAMPLISPLGCALAGMKARVRFTDGSLLRKAYHAGESVEHYHCSFGLNGRYRRLLEGATGIAEYNVPHPSRHEEFGHGNPARSRAVDRHLNLSEFFADDLERVQHGSQSHHCRTMLIIMKDGDRHFSP